MKVNPRNELTVDSINEKLRETKKVWMVLYFWCDLQLLTDVNEQITECAISHLNIPKWFTRSHPLKEEENQDISYVTLTESRLVFLFSSWNDKHPDTKWFPTTDSLRTMLLKKQTRWTLERRRWWGSTNCMTLCWMKLNPGNNQFGFW